MSEAANGKKNVDSVTFSMPALVFALNGYTCMKVLSLYLPAREFDPGEDSLGVPLACAAIVAVTAVLTTQVVLGLFPIFSACYLQMTGREVHANNRRIALAASFGSVLAGAVWLLMFLSHRR